MMIRLLKRQHYFLLFYVITVIGNSQNKKFTKNDTLFGSNHGNRMWWNVLHYDIKIQPDFKTKTLIGSQIITYSVISENETNEMQIDLQKPMIIDSVFLDDVKVLDIKSENNRWLIACGKQLKKSIHYLQLFYHGKPKEAIHPPWNGGWVWKKDSLGNPWMSVACQGDGASVWFPCKDLQSDEPDNGEKLSIIVPDTLVGIGNGKLSDVKKLYGGLTQYTWIVTNTINSYNIVPYIGKYTCIKDSVTGLKGTLLTDYWVLNYHINIATKHLKLNVTKTLSCLEHWFGPYPFYEDSYKIVEAPYLGMEHQSNIAYGNGYQNGYYGSDLSKTGWGLKWDFIVVHETAHEWFGNSITANDVADNWIHEGFASYAEVLFTECEFEKLAGNDYCQGVKKNILNDIPLIGIYSVREEGSGDIYNKGSQVINMIRYIINDDTAFRVLLNSISEKFYHQAVTTQEFEAFICSETKLKLQPFFNQYLRSVKIPTLEYKIKDKIISYRYINCNTDFTMPLTIYANQVLDINPTTQWQTHKLFKAVKKIEIDKNMYVNLSKRKK